MFSGPFNVDGPTDVAYIAHYFTKSKEEFQKKTCVTGLATVDPIGKIKFPHCGEEIADIGPYVWALIFENFYQNHL